MKSELQKNIWKLTGDTYQKYMSPANIYLFLLSLSLTYI